MTELRGEIVGRRMWDYFGGGLLSVFADAEWQPGVNEARCGCDDLLPFMPRRPAVSHRSPAPAPNCTCGLHAYYRLPCDHERIVPVAGLITAWGRVQLHSDGFRAQFARVAALVLPPDGHVVSLRRVARRYSVPLITLEQYSDDAFIGEFGQVVPPHLRPGGGVTARVAA